MAENDFKVVTAAGRVVLEAPEDDARRYVQNNYPRVHTEPGSAAVSKPDAVLVSPDGAKESFSTESGWSDVDDDGSSVTSSANKEPSPTASKAEWKQFALAQPGADADWINDPSTTRNDLVAEYGSGGDEE